MAIRRRTCDYQTRLLPVIAVLVLGVASMACGAEPRAAGKLATKRLGSLPPSLSATLADPTMPPSVTSTTLGAQISQIALTVGCVDILTGALLAGCSITLTPEATFGTGSHNHGGARPAGCFLRSTEAQGLCLQPIAPRGSIVITRAVTDVTGAGGSFNVTYIAPEPSGQIIVSLTGTDPQGNPLTPAQASIDIQIPEQLVALPATGPGFGMDLVTNHANNFALGTVVDRLMAIPMGFSAELLVQRIPAQQVPELRYTSLNLPLGGLFDINDNWRPPHVSHRLGTDADLSMRTIPGGFRATLARVILAEGFHFPVRAESPANPTTNHWHLRRE